MRFEVEQKQLVEKSVKRISLLPTDEQGVFLVEHERYRQRAVGSIGIIGMSQEEIGLLEQGEKAIQDHFTENENGMYVPVNRGYSLATSILVDGSRNTVSAEISGFREMASFLEK